MAEEQKDEKTGNSVTDGLSSFKLEDQIVRAQSQSSWSANDRSATSLFKYRDLTVTLLLLRKGARLKEHTARGSISLQVIAGAIRFRAKGREQTLTSGMLCALDREIPHAVEALEESTLLLTAAVAA
jgi:quercetin dioxygenase-like cupin family protein